MSMLWRDNLQPASFRGAVFHVNTDTKTSGRRIANHEFPKADIPYAEDMGRRSRRFSVTGYIVQGPAEPDYQARRDQLVAALETSGPGMLVHPTMGQDNVICETYSVTESRERGGISEFDIQFREAGAGPPFAFQADTQSAVTAAAQSAQQQFSSIPMPTPAPSPKT